MGADRPGGTGAGGHHAPIPAQAATFLAPRSVAAADGALRQLARWLLASTSIESVAGIRRDDIEDFKVWLSDQDGTNGTLSANTFGQRLRTLRVFFERIIDWDWPDAPPRNPVIGGDIPPRPTHCLGSWTTATRPG